MKAPAERALVQSGNLWKITSRGLDRPDFRAEAPSPGRLPRSRDQRAVPALAAVHRVLCDRILIPQAQVEELAYVTFDRQLAK